MSKALERRRAALGPSAASARMAPVPAPTILVQRLRGVGNARLHQDQSATDYEGKPMWDPRLAMHCLMPADCAVAITGAAHKGDLSGLTGVPLAAELPARAAGLTDRAQMLASALAREQQKRKALEQSEAELRGVGHEAAAAALPQASPAGGCRQGGRGQRGTAGSCSGNRRLRCKDAAGNPVGRGSRRSGTRLLCPHR